MEDWQLDFEWLEVRHKIKERMSVNALPDMQAILYLIGVQELGQGFREFTKEEKTDLMHIAVCALLEKEGYYTFSGLDADGWPHWDMGKPYSTTGKSEQEQLLKRLIIEYFKTEI